MSPTATKSDIEELQKQIRNLSFLVAQLMIQVETLANKDKEVGV